MRPTSPSPSVAPVVDLRPRTPPLDAATDDPWAGAVAYLQRVVEATRGTTDLEVDLIKPFDRRRGAGPDQLARVLRTLDDERPVAFYGWWPTEGAATTTEILGVDAIEVPPPDRKWSGLIDGHAVVLVGYGRHAAFPGGGYLIVRNSWTGWGDGGDGYMPFTYVRAYATELRAYRPADGAGRSEDGGGPSRVDRPAAGVPRLPGVTSSGQDRDGARNAVDVEIDRHARCADPRAALTHLYFSEDLMELARARAICSLCLVRTACLQRALERREPYGVWGGELVIDGVAVADKRGRGRPPRLPRPRLVVDEVTGTPIVA